MPERRVPAITGIGIVSPMGVGCDAFWNRLLSGEPAPLHAPPARPDVPVPGAASIFVPEFRAEDHADPRILRKISDLSRLAVVAACACLDDAGFEGGPEVRDAMGVVVGTAFGSSRYHLEYHEALRRGGVGVASALLFTESVFNAAAGHVSKINRLRGPNLTIVGAEAAGLEAFGRACDRVRLGSCPALLAGGAEQYADLVLASVRGIGLLGERFEGAFAEAPAPFAEGATFLLVEDRDRAQARGAKVLACCRGTCHRRRGRGEHAHGPVVEAARGALEEAGLRAGAVDLIVCGAAGGPAAAPLRKAIGALFGTRHEPLKTAPKSLVGEGFAHTSALLIACASLAIFHGVVPPSFGGPDPGFAEEPVEGPLSNALVLAATPSGGASAVVLGRAS